MNRSRFLSIAVCLVFSFSGICLNAALVTFSDKNAFFSASGASSATGPLPDIGWVTGGQATVGSVTFTISPPSTNFAIGTMGISTLPSNDWYAWLPGEDIAIGGSENLNLDFASPVFSAGFDFAEPDTTMPFPYGNSGNRFGVNSTFTVSLISGMTTVGSFTFDAPDDVLAFVGVWSDTAFDRMEIRETSGGIDDEYFGEVFAGFQPLPSSVVPTLSQWGLLLLGLTILCLGAIGLHLRVRRQKGAAVN